MYCEASMPPRNSSQLCQSELYRSDFFKATGSLHPGQLACWLARPAVLLGELADRLAAGRDRELVADRAVARESRSGNRALLR